MRSPTKAVPLETIGPQGKTKKSLGGCGKAENQEKASRTGRTHRRGKTSDLVANLPQGREIGRTREWVSVCVGMKARTYLVK